MSVEALSTMGLITLYVLTYSVGAFCVGSASTMPVPDEESESDYQPMENGNEEDLV